MFIEYWYSYVSGCWLITRGYGERDDVINPQFPSECIWLVPGTWKEEEEEEEG